MGTLTKHFTPIAHATRPTVYAGCAKRKASDGKRELVTHLRVAPHNYSTDRWTVDYLDVAVWVDASLGNDFASPEEAAAAALVRYGKITPFKPN